MAAEIARAAAEAAEAAEAERLAAEASLVEGEEGEAPSADAPAEEKPVAEPPEPALEVRFLDRDVRSFLTRSLGYRARIQIRFGEEDLARQSLERMLTIDPGAVIDRESAPAELLKLSDRLRRRLVGNVNLQLEPPDAEVTIDGRRVDPAAGPISALSGQRWLDVERVGYEPLSQEIEIAAGRQTDYEIALERTSPVLRLHTRPNGAEVTIDGEVVGVTEGMAPEDFLRHGSYRRDEFSSELVLTGVEPGLRVLQVVKDGYRSYRSELRIDELIDYPMPPIVLERESGTLVFRDLPADARIVVDGRPARVENPGASRPRITLEPGEHEVRISSSSSRMFSSRFFLADRQTIDVNVRLLPGVAFLGILGRRGEVAANLARALKVTLGDAGKWAVLDRSREGPGVLAAVGVTAEALVAASDDRDAREQAARTGSLPPPTRDDAIDWRRVQQAVDRQAPGMLYVVAVVVEDLLESNARIFVWPAAPGPSEPDVVKLPLGEPGAANRLGAAFHRRIALRAPWFGALLIDGAVGPVVADVTPGSPAETAGLTVGDQVVDADRIPVASRAAFDNRIAAAGIGATIELRLRSATGEERTASLRVGTSPWLRADFGDGGLDSVTYTDLELMAEEAASEDLWLIRTNQALLLLRAGEAEEAVRRLRSVGAPQSSHGVSQATVDYWLAMALEATGPGYRDAARALLERAAGSPGARLFDHDGAYLAPRARARLRAMGAAN
ncbi:MAG: PEGA domain-containing protein [Thermoanaerobaculia bacterium]